MQVVVPLEAPVVFRAQPRPLQATATIRAGRQRTRQQTPTPDPWRRSQPHLSLGYWLVVVRYWSLMHAKGKSPPRATEPLIHSRRENDYESREVRDNESIGPRWDRYMTCPINSRLIKVARRYNLCLKRLTLAALTVLGPCLYLTTSHTAMLSLECLRKHRGFETMRFSGSSSSATTQRCQSILPDNDSRLVPLSRNVDHRNSRIFHVLADILCGPVAVAVRDHAGNGQHR